MIDEKGLEAALEAWARDWREGPPEQDTRSAMTAAITAYLSARSAEAVAKLEWRKTGEGFGGFIGQKQYRFVKYGWGGPEYGFQDYPTIEDAQAAAQEDFEATVREYAALFAHPKEPPDV